VTRKITQERKWHKTVPAWIIALCLLATFSLGAAPEKKLPGYVVQALAQIEETYHILDLAAEKIWPGWTNYRDFPFMLEYKNGLKVLVGHPNPPAEFKKIEGARMENMDVYADFSQVSDYKMEPPFMAGGGPLDFGKTKDGKPVKTIFMNFFEPKGDMKGGYGLVGGPYSVESQILGYIHELFHCFQFNGSNIKFDRVGNLRFNPNADYAVYSEIEGKALLNAYQAKDPEEAKTFIRDFLAARKIKQAKSMPEQQQKEGSHDELMEGTAVYTSVRLSEILKQGYKTKIDPSQDPYFSGFQNAGFFIEGYQKRLKAAAEEIFDAKGKCYEYGCYQALLLQRLYPGWQKVFSEKQTTLDKELADRVPIRDEDLPQYEKRFKDIYVIDGIQARCREVIGKRDDAYHALMDRKGMAYIVNFKKVRQYEMQLYEKEPKLTLGLINMYLEGVPAVTIGKIELSAIAGPVEGNQLYHLKVVDTQWKTGGKPYSIEYQKKDGNVYEGAVIKTPLFILKAPLVRIDETSSRVKFTLLPVIQGQS